MQVLLDKGLPSGVCALAFLTVGVMLAGCARVASTESSTPVPLASPSLSDEAHDLAILSVDFSPPLTARDPERPPTLLVAVDNRGRVPERRVVVEVRMIATDGSLLSEAREVIAALAPGEARVVRFSAPALPLDRQNYQLGISVASVDGERQVLNNRRSLRVGVGSDVTMAQ